MIFPYIDDEPIIPLDIQAKSGVWEEGRKVFFTVGDGAQIPSYIHKVPVKFAGEEFMAEIAFSASLGVGTNLLGLKSFFDKFSFCFHHFLKKVEIRKDR